jgi:hypothetical protein
MASERKTYVLKVRKKQGRLWVLFDEQHLMEGNPGETQDELIARRKDIHGPTGCLVEYVGTHTVAELTATMRKVRAGNLEEESESTREGFPNYWKMSLAEQLLTLSQRMRGSVQKIAENLRAESDSAPRSDESPPELPDDAEKQAAKRIAEERLHQLLADTADEASGFVVAPVGGKPEREPRGWLPGPESADETPKSGPSPDKPKSPDSAPPADATDHVTDHESAMPQERTCPSKCTSNNIN